MNAYELGYDYSLSKEPLFAPKNSDVFNGVYAGEIRSGELTQNLSIVKGFLQSENFKTLTSGWRITAEGDAEFDSGYFRGSITGATGSFSGSITIGSGDNVFKANGTDGIWLGDADFADGKFKVTLAGALTSTSATITGALTTGAGSSINGTYIDSLSVAKLSAGTISSKLITLAISAGTGDTAIQAGKTDFTNTETGFILGLDDSDSDKPKFYIGSSTKYLNWDGADLTIRGTLNADDITAGTIIGRTLQSSALGGSSGSGVLVSSGNNAPIEFYYNGTKTCTLDGYTTEGSEISYLRIVAESGRKIILKNSFIEVNGNLLSNDNDTNYVGTSGTRWARMYAGRFYQKDTGDGETCFGFGYVEMGLLSEEMKEKYLEKDANGNRPIDRIPEESIRLPFPLGSVLVYKDNGLELSSKLDDKDVVAIANKRGLPIIIGADPVLVKGKVKRGDIIVSGKNGIGVVKKNAKNPIGKALEEKDKKDIGLVKVMIRFPKL